MQIGRGRTRAAVEGKSDGPVGCRFAGIQDIGDIEDIGFVLALGVQHRQAAGGDVIFQRASGQRYMLLAGHVGRHGGAFDRLFRRFRRCVGREERGREGSGENKGKDGAERSGTRVHGLRLGLSLTGF